MTHSRTATGFAGARADREARLSPDTVAWLTTSGLPRHFVPRGHGGTCGTFAELFAAAAIEAETCASAAWCGALWAWHARCAAMLPERARREIWGASPDVLISAGLKPSGRAQPVPSGWRVTGSWTRVSGAVYAQWILLAVGDGLPEPLILATPADAVTVVPTWDAAGLRATRTDTVAARGIFVPEHRAVPLALFLNGLRTEDDTPGGVGGEPLPRNVTTPAMLGGPVLLCAPALGSARAAVRAWAQSEGLGSSANADDDPEAREWCSSRLEDISVLLERAAERADQGPVNATAVDRNRRDVAAAADMLRDVIERAARSAGSAASPTRAVLERSRRDVYTATSHAALRPFAAAAVAQPALDGRVLTPAAAVAAVAAAAPSTMTAAGTQVPPPAAPGCRTRRPVIVFCDVDETLIGCKSLLDFAAFARYRVDAAESPAAAAAVSRSTANERFYASLADQPARQIANEALAWYACRSLATRFFIAPTRAELARHRAAGARIALVSGSMPALLRPIADAVGAHHLLCSNPEVLAGRLTGRLVGPPVIGEAKRAAVRRLLAQFPDTRPEDCVGYGDHVSDAPMLEEVGRPVIVGGDPGLVRLVPHARVLER